MFCGLIAIFFKSITTACQFLTRECMSTTHADNDPGGTIGHLGGFKQRGAGGDHECECRDERVTRTSHIMNGHRDRRIVNAFLPRLFEYRNTVFSACKYDRRV